MSLIMCADYIRERDPIIRRCNAAGIPKAEIARIIGLSRQTVQGITTRRPAPASPRLRAAQQPKDDTP